MYFDDLTNNNRNLMGFLTSEKKADFNLELSTLPLLGVQVLSEHQIPVHFRNTCTFHHFRNSTKLKYYIMFIMVMCTSMIQIQGSTPCSGYVA